MKLVSNFKDYYDYLIGTYGIDPKAVYHRVCETEIQKNDVLSYEKQGLYKPPHLIPGTRAATYTIAFCGTIYCVFWLEGKFYFGSDSYYVRDQIDELDYNREWRERAYRPHHLSKTTLNDHFGCPVLLLRRRKLTDTDDLRQDYWVRVKNPKLSDFGFPSIIPADECFMRITNFLLREKEIKDNRTDKEKIASKGFDVKTSFRNM